MKVGYKTATGIEIVDDDRVPPGEIWFNTPKADGMQATYLIMLNDWRIMLRDDRESFLEQMDGWLSELSTTVYSGQPDFAIAKIDLIRQAIDDFKRGKT